MFLIPLQVWFPRHHEGKCQPRWNNQHIGVIPNVSLMVPEVLRTFWPGWPGRTILRR